MSKMRQLAFIFLSIILSFVLVACEEDEDQQIAEAQACLNKATPANANACLTKVSGLTSERAYYIRCSVRFLSQGFQGSRFADAFEQLSEENDGGGGGGNDAMATALTVMTFDSTTVAESTLNECLLSGSTGLSRLASISSIATTLVNAVPGVDLTDVAENGLSDTDAQTLIDNLTTGGAETSDAELGAIAVTAEGLFYDDEDSEFKDTDICTNLEAAVGAGDAAAVGAALRAALAAN